MAVTKWKVPAAVATGIICFLAGAGAGGLGMAVFGYRWHEPEPQQPAGPPPGPPMNASAMLATRPKNQLVALVAKLDQLTGEPLALTLTEGQRAAIREQLRDLDEKEVSDEEAERRLKAILEAVKGQRGTLEAAGYRWPGEGAGPPPSSALNPFAEEQNAKHLKSLRGHLANGVGR
jgi:hypothetical protein